MLYVIEITNPMPSVFASTIRAAEPSGATRFPLWSVTVGDKNVNIESVVPLSFDGFENKAGRSGVNELPRYKYSIPSHLVAIDR